MAKNGLISRVKRLEKREGMDSWIVVFCDKPNGQTVQGVRNETARKHGISPEDSRIVVVTWDW